MTYTACRVSISVYAMMLHSSKRLEFGDSVYFHRNTLARSSPREFYGFFSINHDPCASCTGLEDLGWEFEYRV